LAQTADPFWTDEDLAYKVLVYVASNMIGLGSIK